MGDSQLAPGPAPEPAPEPAKRKKKIEPERKKKIEPEPRPGWCAMCAHQITLTEDATEDDLDGIVCGECGGLGFTTTCPSYE